MKHAAIIKSIFATVVFVSFCAWAATETVGDYTWIYQINCGTAENVI